MPLITSNIINNYLTAKKSGPRLGTEELLFEQTLTSCTNALNEWIEDT